MDGYSKDVLRDLTVNRWRSVIIALVIFVALLGLMVMQLASMAFIWVIVVLAVYLLASLMAVANYALFKRPDGSIPKSNGSLLLSVVVLLLPKEMLAK